MQHLKLDGTPDRRYKQQTATAVAPSQTFTFSGSTIRYGKLSATVGRTGMAISCGVQQMYGLGGLDVMAKTVGHERMVEGMKLFIDHLNKGTAAHIVCSDNTNRENIAKVLDEICEQDTQRKRNPNSGSSIKVWLL